MIETASYDSEPSAWQWWESRRLRYNVGLIIAGALAFICYVAVYIALSSRLSPEIDITIFTVIFQAAGFFFYVLLANVLFCLGALSERLPRMRTLAEHRRMTFALGFWLSAALPFSQPLLLAYHALNGSKM